MKKLILSLIAVAVGTLSSFAQSDLVATLSHGSSLSTFSGIDALAQAYAAAEEGDVITLSPGVFNAVNIEKAITVRGAGMQPMESNGYVATELSGIFTINVPSDAASNCMIEGAKMLGRVDVYGSNMAPMVFSKCRFEGILYACGVSMTAHSCFFAHLWALYENNSIYKNTTINCFNCIILNATTAGYNTAQAVSAKIIASNSIVLPWGNGVPNSVFYNCIIIAGYAGGTYYNPLPETCSADHCIGIWQRDTDDLFCNIVNSTNTMLEGRGEAAFTNVFKSITSVGNLSSINATFELTETAAATYLGDDGTQVGIYGGTNPFNPTPTNPQVKKFTVNSTTEGDRLKVKINVE